MDDHGTGALMSRLLACLLAGLSLLFVSGPGPLKAQELARAPLRLAYGNSFTIPVYVNGNGPFDFIVDTASTNTVLFASLVETLDLPLEEDALANVIFSLGEQQIPVREIQSIRINRLERHDIKVALAPDWDIPDQENPAGLLGADFLSRYFVLFDVEGAALEIHGRHPGDLDGKWASEDLTPVTLGVLSSPVFLTKMTLNRRRFDALIDTGSSASFLSWSGARALGARMRKPRPVQNGMTDASGMLGSVGVVEVAHTALGRKSWRDRIFIVKDLRIFDYMDPYYENKAVLGANLLRQQNTAIDFPGRKIWIKRR